MDTDLTECIIRSVKDGDIDGLRELLTTGSPSPSDSSDILAATIDGDSTDCLTALLPFTDPTSNDCYPLLKAAHVGKPVFVSILSPVSTAKARTAALKIAAEHGHHKCVEILIENADAGDNNSEALRGAARHGHVRCVELLIPVSDPKASKSSALFGAVSNGHIDCAKALLPVSDMASMMDNLIEADKTSALNLLAAIIESDRMSLAVSSLKPQRAAQTAASCN